MGVCQVPYNWLVMVAEAMLIILFLLSFWFFRKRWLHLVMLWVFGYLIEWSAIHLSPKVPYTYNMYLKIMDVPVAIACGWAVILLSAIFLVRLIPAHPLLSALAGGTFAVLLDFALEPASVSLGIWRWHLPGHPAPFGNFFGWWLAGFVAALGDLLFEKNDLAKGMLPIVLWFPIMYGYGLYLTGGRWEAPLFAAVFLLGVLVVKLWGFGGVVYPRELAIARMLMYIYSLIVVLVVPAENWVVLMVVGALAGEMFLASQPYDII